MKTAQILKLALVVAILFALFRLVARRPGAGWSVQPYSFERYEDEPSEEPDYEHGEHDEDDEDGEDDEEYEDDEYYEDD